MGLAFCIGVVGITGGMGVIILAGIPISGTLGGIGVITLPGVIGNLSL